jgi:putative ABC transport system permease protein
VLTAFIDKVLNDKYPDKKRDRLLYVKNIELRGKQAFNGGSLSFYLLNEFARRSTTPAKIAISSNYQGTNTYVNNKKIAVNFKYTNDEYWEVLDYDFLEGKPFTKQQLANGENVAVISRDLKEAYFGDISTVVGKYIEADNSTYRIMGVVENVPITLAMMYGDMYLPYTLSKTDYRKKEYLGSYTAIFLANSRSDLPKIRKEYEDMINRLPMISDEHDHIYSHADPFVTAYLRTGNEKSSGLVIAVTAITIFVLLIMLIPTLNLVNINITRIMERSSEIGVRKAFGASSSTLVYQFIVENLILTVLGGLIALVFSSFCLYIINKANLIANLQLSLNYTVLLIGLVICILFGLISGVYPAWRMSKLNVVTALKA